MTRRSTWEALFAPRDAAPDCTNVAGRNPIPLSEFTRRGVGLGSNLTHIVPSYFRNAVAHVFLEVGCVDNVVGLPASTRLNIADLAWRYAKFCGELGSAWSPACPNLIHLILSKPRVWVPRSYRQGPMKLPVREILLWRCPAQVVRPIVARITVVMSRMHSRLGRSMKRGTNHSMAGNMGILAIARKTIAMITPVFDLGRQDQTFFCGHDCRISRVRDIARFRANTSVARCAVIALPSGDGFPYFIGTANA